MPKYRNTGLAVVMLGGSVGLSLSPVIAARPAPTARPLTAVDAGVMRQKLAKLRGKVVVLNMWATWCGPCVHEFPDLVRLDKAYRSRGVVVIGLSIDDPQQSRALVPPFLAKHRASFPVYVLKPGDPTAVVQVFDKYWKGSIPVTYFFDRSGKLQTRLEGARTLDGFEMALKPLLGPGKTKAASRVSGSE